MSTPTRPENDHHTVSTVDRTMATTICALMLGAMLVTPWQTQTIWWLAGVAAVTFVTRNQESGGLVRTIAHLMVGALAFGAAPALAEMFANPGGRMTSDETLRCVANALTIGVAADTLLWTWTGRGLPERTAWTADDTNT